MSPHLVLYSPIFYLISHNRPINELLNPNFKDISREYREEFVDMAKNEISPEELFVGQSCEACKQIGLSLAETDKKFLISFVSNDPDWTLVRDSKIRDYPPVKWKMMNQEKMGKNKLEEYINTRKSI